MKQLKTTTVLVWILALLIGINVREAMAATPDAPASSPGFSLFRAPDVASPLYYRGALPASLPTILAAAAPTNLTPAGAYVSPDGGTTFNPMTTTATGTALPFPPAPAAMYCSNDSGVTWIPCSQPGAGQGTVAAGTGIAFYNPGGGTTINGANITGIVKGNGSSVPTAAAPGIDYVAPTAMPTATVVFYRYNQGSGTTVTDYSGNGYNATLGTAGRAPTWLSNGLQFPAGTGVDMPSQAAINTAQTWCWVGNFTPLSQSAFQQAGFSSLMASNDGGTNGVTYELQYTGSLNNGSYSLSPGPGIASFNTFVTGAGVSAIDQGFSGPQRICIVRGKTSNSTVDHIYLNGVETDKYFKQGKTGDTTNSTFYSIGATASGNWTVGMFGSTMYATVGFAGQLTAAQVAQADQALQFDLQSRGIPLNTVYQQHSQIQLVHVGDSITACQGVSPSSACWNNGTNLTSLLTNQPAYTVQVYGVTGVTAFAINNAEPNRAAQFCQSSQGQGVVTLWTLTNDLATWLTSTTTPTYVSLLAGAVSKYKQAGCKVYVATTISRCGNWGSSGCSAAGTFEAERAVINNAVRQQVKSAIGADGIIDAAANPHLGKTNQYNGGAGGGTCSGATTYFQSDCVHPNSTAQPDIDAFMANSLNYYTGTTKANPYVVSSTTTLPSSARYVDATACSGCTLTLPDGIGPSGENYQIQTGAGAVSVQGQTLYGAAQTVNGSSSAVPLPINSLITLGIVPLAQATAGIQWNLSSVPNNATLSGTTGSIGGSPLTAGTCASGTSTVSGAVVGMVAVTNISDGSLTDPLTDVDAAVTSANTVTVQVCAIAAVTPAAKTYNVRVIP